MTLVVSEAEAATQLCQVPVCIGCNRVATGHARTRLRAARPGVPPAGGEDILAAAVMVAAAAADIVGRATAAYTVVVYPTCWRHRWINRPTLGLESIKDGRVTLSGVSAEFVAGWVAVQGTPAASLDQPTRHSS